jgi:DNA-binding response OmpR family regulator
MTDYARAPRVLVVEDDEDIADVLVRSLRLEGYDVRLSADGIAALDDAHAFLPDVVILDLGLPRMDGVEVAKHLRGDDDVPILMLTARDALEARVTGLDAGADDYLVKPFAFAELLARLRALLRRASAPRWAPLACADLSLDPSTGAHVGNRSVSLSPRERALLELLLRRQGEVVGRPEILREAFGYDFDPGTNVIDVHMAHLRRKLDGSAARLETVRGVGFRLRSGGPAAAGGDDDV